MAPSVICRGERRQSWGSVHRIPRPCKLGRGAGLDWPAGTRGRLASHGLAVGSAGVADVLSTPCTGQEASSGPGRGPSLVTHHPLFQSVMSSFFMML